MMKAKFEERLALLKLVGGAINDHPTEGKTDEQWLTINLGNSKRQWNRTFEEALQHAHMLYTDSVRGSSDAHGGELTYICVNLGSVAQITEETEETNDE